MTNPAVQVERRVGQRFPYLLPISFRQAELDGVGFTQDLSSRGVFFFTDAPLTAGSQIELTLRMPSEITLGESMRVRCSGHILRIVKTPVDGTAGHAEPKVGVAVKFEGYEYLTESADSPSAFARVSALHPQHEEDRTVAQSAVRPVLG
jgi:hypothetical protein